MAFLRSCQRFQLSVKPLCTTTVLYQPDSVKTSLPDYNTSVDVHTHKLKRPEKIQRGAEIKQNVKRNLTSLIPETLRDMEVNEDFQVTAAQLKKLGQKQLTKDERRKRQRALHNLQVPDFRSFLMKNPTDDGAKLTHFLRKTPIQVLQLNIGLYCNQACVHCHVESSPKRKEMMNRETAEKCMDILERSPTIHTVDITGGAPELCSEFRYLVKRGRELGRTIIDRCNLTCLLEPGQEDTADFLAEHEVTVIASLPCYSAKNVNMQRGSQVFQRSMEALKILNALGYGKPDSGLMLHLVYNPIGAFLPPPQADLEAKYKDELWKCFNIEFNNLFTLTNMPIKRFADFLYRRNELQSYMEVLVRNFNAASLQGLMCRNYISVGWDGSLFDCDFNQQLDIPMKKPRNSVTNAWPTVWDIQKAEELENQRIMTDNHCFGCTSGMGSSCQGTTV
ncbi:hypothetical protein BSL78_11393 [Apostichopus japonicus]|uniref:Uncharacterized protein n=1 Tax=Stichopus japonicus TaxID=307972 RepID=A0A2G8KUY2_STIJA|nr:hypothetical protein BSL78_11393 [Apostichopus japonicus]